MHEVLVNRLGGLSLPRKSVVRLTDRPDMTLDVYRGSKTTIQQYNRAVNWAKIWRMFFNTSKCHHLHVGKHDSGIRYTMTANNQEIELEKVESEKDLGVIIDQNLTFRAHITSKVNIANKNLGIIFRTFTYIDQEMFLNLYKSVVRPHATPVWLPFYKKE